MDDYQKAYEAGENYLHNEELGKAVQAFGRAAQLQPDRKEPLTKLGMICQENGDLDGAAAFFLKAAHMDYADAYLRLNLGLVFYEQGNLDEAAYVLKRTAELIERGIDETRSLLEEGDALQPDAVREQLHELEVTVADVRELLQEIASKSTGAPDKPLERYQVG